MWTSTAELWIFLLCDLRVASKGTSVIRMVGKWKADGELGNFLCSQPTVSWKERNTCCKLSGAQCSCTGTAYPCLFWFASPFRRVSATTYLYLKEPRSRHKSKCKQMQVMNFSVSSGIYNKKLLSLGSDLAFPFMIGTDNWKVSDQPNKHSTWETLAQGRCGCMLSRVQEQQLPNRDEQGDPSQHDSSQYWVAACKQHVFPLLCLGSL